MTQIQKNEEKNKDYYKENEILLNQKIKSLKSEVIIYISSPTSSLSPNLSLYIYFTNIFNYYFY